MTKRRRARRSSTVGLLNGRINWDDWINRAVAFWAGKRFSGKFIAKMTGLTVGQVYARCQKYGIQLRASRNGEGKDSEITAKMYSAGTITRARKVYIMDNFANPDEE